MISGTASSRSTRVFHFVTGSNMRTMSTTWCASLWSLSDDGLAGDRDHRGPVEERVGDPGQEVGGAGAEGREGHRRPAGEPAVDVGHERGALLVAGRDVADGLGPRERVEERHRLLAGHREDPSAAFGLEAFHDQAGGGPGRLCCARHVRSVATTRVPPP